MRLNTAEVEDALAYYRSSTGLEVDARGFHILDEEPDLYNKWLYGIPNGSGHHWLLGLSQRFCPVANHPYAGFSLYHPDLHQRPELLLSALRTIVRHFLQLPSTWDRTSGILRGLIEGADESLRDRFAEFSEEEPLQFKRLEEDISSDLVACERTRTAWHGNLGPIWTDSTSLTAEILRFADAESVYTMQHVLNNYLGYKNNWPLLRNGIHSSSERHQRHGYLSIFNRGAFLVARVAGVVAGSVWCYRSFNPCCRGWTIWFRRPFILPQFREFGAQRGLARAAVGMFAEAGYPVRLRRLCPKDAPDTALIGTLVESSVNGIYLI